MLDEAGTIRQCCPMMNALRTRLPLRRTFIAGLAMLSMVCMTAAGAAAEDEVPLPKLPDGAGPMDKSAPKTFTVTESGLKYRVLRQGSSLKPVPQSRVEINYVGWLYNGRVFDSSYARGMPTVLSLAQVVKGWTEGMQKVGKGGMIELEIPGYLGYGLAGQPSGGIPPNATLHFIVELINVVE